MKHSTVVLFRYFKKELYSAWAIFLIITMTGLFLLTTTISTDRLSVTSMLATGYIVLVPLVIIIGCIRYLPILLTSWQSKNLLKNFGATSYKKTYVQSYVFIAVWSIYILFGSILLTNLITMLSQWGKVSFDSHDMASVFKLVLFVGSTTPILLLLSYISKQWMKVSYVLPSLLILTNITLMMQTYQPTNGLEENYDLERELRFEIIDGEAIWITDYNVPIYQDPYYFSTAPKYINHVSIDRKYRNTSYVYDDTFPDGARKRYISEVKKLLSMKIYSHNGTLYDINHKYYFMEQNANKVTTNISKFVSALSFTSYAKEAYDTWIPSFFTGGRSQDYTALFYNYIELEGRIKIEFADSKISDLPHNPAGIPDVLPQNVPVYVSTQRFSLNFLHYLTQFIMSAAFVVGGGIIYEKRK